MADTKPIEEPKDPSTENTKIEPVVIKQPFNIKTIVSRLHIAANEHAAKGGYRIQNTAIEVDNGDENSARFYGAGQHEIIAIAEKGNADRKTAHGVLQEYVSWFAGPDVKISPDSLQPMKGEEELDKQNNKKDQKKDDKAKEAKEAKDDKKDSEETKTNKKDVKNESFSPSFNFSIPSFISFLNEADEEPKEKDEKKEELKTKNGEDNNVKGFYIQYQIDIDGMKRHPLADNIKRAGKNLLNFLKDVKVNFGWLPNAFWGGGESKTKSLGEIGDALFGGNYVDPDKFKSHFESLFNKKYKQDFSDSAITIFTTNILKKYLTKFKAPSNTNKLLKGVEYALCIKLNKNDRAHELLRGDELADMASDALDDTFREEDKSPPKTLKSKPLTKKDVILINNYDDQIKKTGKDKGLEYTSDKTTGVEDSLITNYYGNLIKEEGEEEKSNDGSDGKEKQNEVVVSEKDMENIKKEIKTNLEKELKASIRPMIDPDIYKIKFGVKAPNPQSILDDYVIIDIQKLIDIQKQFVSKINGKLKAIDIKDDSNKEKGKNDKTRMKYDSGLVVVIKLADIIDKDKASFEIPESITNEITNNLLKMLFEADDELSKDKSDKEDKNAEDASKAKTDEIKTVNAEEIKKMFDEIAEKNNVKSIGELEVITDPQLSKYFQKQKEHKGENGQLGISDYNKIVKAKIEKYFKKEYESVTGKNRPKQVIDIVKQQIADLEAKDKDDSVDGKTKRNTIRPKIKELKKNLGELERFVNDYKNSLVDKQKDAKGDENKEHENDQIAYQMITPDSLERNKISQIIVVPFQSHFLSDNSSVEKKVKRTDLDFFIIPIKYLKQSDDSSKGK